MSFNTFKLSLGALAISGLVFAGSTLFISKDADISELPIENSVNSEVISTVSSETNNESATPPDLDLSKRDKVVSTLRAHGCKVTFAAGHEAFMNRYLSNVPAKIFRDIGNACFDKNAVTVKLVWNFWRNRYYWSVY